MSANNSQCYRKTSHEYRLNNVIMIIYQLTYLLLNILHYTSMIYNLKRNKITKSYLNNNEKFIWNVFHF